jgi:hypothetical protein
MDDGTALRPRWRAVKTDRHPVSSVADRWTIVCLAGLPAVNQSGPTVRRLLGRTLYAPYGVPFVCTAVRPQAPVERRSTVRLAFPSPACHDLSSNYTRSGRICDHRLGVGGGTRTPLNRPGLVRALAGREPGRRVSAGPVRPVLGVWPVTDTSVRTPNPTTREFVRRHVVGVDGPSYRLRAHQAHADALRTSAVPDRQWLTWPTTSLR